MWFICEYLSRSTIYIYCHICIYLFFLFNGEVKKYYYYYYYIQIQSINIIISLLSLLLSSLFVSLQLLTGIIIIIKNLNVKLYTCRLYANSTDKIHCTSHTHKTLWQHANMQQDTHAWHITHYTTALIPVRH